MIKKKEVFEFLDFHYWLPIVKKIVGNQPVDFNSNNYLKLKSIVKEEFLSNFKFLRAFHGCRPLDVQTYYEYGLKPLNSKSTNEWIKSFFSQNYPKLDNKFVEGAISQSNKTLSVTEGRIYFVIDDQLLIKECGHYLLYGSEYILGIFKMVESQTGELLIHHLQGNTQPTIFVCNIPFNLLSESIRDSLVDSLVRCVVYNDGYEREPLNFGFPIFEGLPPSQIVEHFHPTKIIDPLN